MHDIEYLLYCTVGFSVKNGYDSEDIFFDKA